MLVCEEYYWGCVNKYLHYLSSISIDLYHMPGPLKGTSKNFKDRKSLQSSNSLICGTILWHHVRVWTIVADLHVAVNGRRPHS